MMKLFDCSQLTVAISLTTGDRMVPILPVAEARLSAVERSCVGYSSRVNEYASENAVEQLIWPSQQNKIMPKFPTGSVHRV